VRHALQADSSTVEADILGQHVTYKLGAPGKHLVLNSLAVLAACALARAALGMPGGSALLIDESYNANPASMRAAIALLGQAPVGARGRRIAVLGDMLELGEQGAALHRGLAAAITEANINLVFCSGPLMQALWEALPSSRRGGYAESAAGLEPAVLDAVGPGDAVMVKGSLGSKMAPVVKALERQFPH